MVSVVGSGDLRYFKNNAWQSLGQVLGGDISGSSVLDLCRNWPYMDHMDYPSFGGTATINSNNVGLYDWVTKVGNQTVSSSDMSAWFTGSVDTRSAWIIVDGNLTVDSGALLLPPSRKLFTVVYVTGDLTVNGEISMTMRGANHSGTGISGGATTAVDLRIATGTFSAVVDPQVPASGGAGGASVTSANGNTGSAGSGGGTGGGGSGGNVISGSSGAGSAGTSFTGGTGGGGSIGANGTAGGANGGSGGNGASSGNPYWSSGGGNPGGTAGGTAAQRPARSGTGGVLLVIVEGQLSGSGLVSADAVKNIVGVFRTGGSAGGGHVTIMYGTDVSSITPTAAGGSADNSFAAGASYGGGGGAGTARKLAL